MQGSTYVGVLSGQLGTPGEFVSQLEHVLEIGPIFTLNVAVLREVFEDRQWSSNGAAVQQLKKVELSPVTWHLPNGEKSWDKVAASFL